MISKDDKILRNAFFKKPSGKIPFWFMRQAGRYLPEYKAVRSTAPDFLTMCYTPSLATEVTLQPIRRFGMSGAIIFSDILVVPDALGVHVRFEEKRGPVLSPVTSYDGVKALRWNQEKLSPVYEALRNTRAQLPPETTLLGFSGSPWTLACYMVQGVSDQKFDNVKDIAKNDLRFFTSLMDVLTQSVTQHCQRQIEAGAEVIQLFDSWAGVLDDDGFKRWVIEPNKAIVSALKKIHPDVPIIGFPRNAGTKYKSYAIETEVDGVSVDYTLELEWIRNELQDICLVQGNLDPELFAGDKDAMLAQARKIISTLSNKPFIFNLGHGILPHTPVENVQALCDYLCGVII